LGALASWRHFTRYRQGTATPHPRPQGSAKDRSAPQAKSPRSGCLSPIQIRHRRYPPFVRPPAHDREPDTSTFVPVSTVEPLKHSKDAIERALLNPDTVVFEPRTTLLWLRTSRISSSRRIADSRSARGNMETPRLAVVVELASRRLLKNSPGEGTGPTGLLIPAQNL